MSLIHDALKKTELEKKPEGQNPPPPFNPIIPDKKPPKNLTPILLGVLGVAILFLLYTRVLRKPAPEGIPQPITAIPSVPQLQQQNPAKLKEEALQLYQENKLEDSVKIWEQLTLLLPTDAEVYNNLGLIRKKMGRKKEAYEAYNQALALDKDYPEGLNNLGVLTLSDGDVSKAKGLFEKAIGLKKEYADPHFNLALIQEQEGNAADALTHYREFLNLSPPLDEELQKRIQEKIKNLEPK